MEEEIPILLKLPAWHSLFRDVVERVDNYLVAHELNNRFFEFRTAWRDPIFLAEDDLKAIYPQLPVIILNFLIAQLAYQPICFWVVRSDNSISKVSEMKGADNDPLRCKANTLRFIVAQMIGRRELRLRDGNDQPGVVVYENFIHVPKPEEVARNMAVLRRFIPA